MGYKLYASMGTADFYTEHGIRVSRQIYNEGKVYCMGKNCARERELIWVSVQFIIRSIYPNHGQN